LYSADINLMGIVAPFKQIRPLHLKTLKAPMVQRLVILIKTGGSTDSRIVA
jgi:hypothetical protein